MCNMYTTRSAGSMQHRHDYTMLEAPDSRMVARFIATAEILMQAAVCCDQEQPCAVKAAEQAR